MYSSVRRLETVNQGQNSQLFLQDLHTSPDLYQDGWDVQKGQNPEILTINF